MSRFRRQNTPTRMFMRCDICWQLREVLHFALDGLKKLNKDKLTQELLDKHFSHGVQNFCINMTDQHSILLHSDRLSLPKYVRRGGEDTVKSGWPEAYFFMTCEDIMHALPPSYLLNIANARADGVRQHGPDGEIDVCVHRYQCFPSTEKERMTWAIDMKEQGFPPAWVPPGHPKPYEEKRFTLTEEKKKRLEELKRTGFKGRRPKQETEQDKKS